MREQQQLLAQKVNELQDVLEEERTLRGTLPICMYCKKIRDEEDRWDAIEKYLAVHSDVDFSHGICPDCMETHYPGSVDD